MDAITSFKVYLMTSDDGTTWNKLVDIKDFPDLGGEPEMLETTTLSDPMQTFKKGIQSLEALTFTTNYNLTDFTAIKALSGTQKHYSVWFGGNGEGADATPTGKDGTFSLQGEISVFANGAGVNEIVDMTITIAPATPIEADANA